MSERNESVEQERRQRMLELLPDMEKRYRTLRSLLEQAADGNDVNESRLRLAQRDLFAVLAVMTEYDATDEED